MLHVHHHQPHLIYVGKVNKTELDFQGHDVHLAATAYLNSMGQINGS